jgi:hypothetical protein
MTMDLDCFVYPGWEPQIRPASARRDWMDASPESFAYRCLPLAIANGHGWEILSPCGFEAVWNGGPAAEDVIIRMDPGAEAHRAPVALFGVGTITFHVEGLFRTPPGWNLWVGGPPNAMKDGAAPLNGLIETDWSPYSFTMNWKLTRAGYPVRFEAGEPIAHIFPVERQVLENVTPRFRPIDEAPELKAQFEAWSRSRDAFQARMKSDPPSVPAEKWQKLYYRGLTPEGKCPVSDHQSKLRAPAFQGQALVAPKIPRPPAAKPAASTAVVPASAPQLGAPSRIGPAGFAERKYAWVLETLERQRRLSDKAAGLFRAEGISQQDFLDHHYAANRPLIIGGETADWPALKLWTPDYLRHLIGDSPVDLQADRGSAADFERYKDRHRQSLPFNVFIDRITGAGSDNDLYLTAYNSGANRDALAPLSADLGFLPKFLNQSTPGEGGMAWIGPANTFTPLHHDLTNNLLVQIVGRKRLLLAPPTATPHIYNDLHVFSEITDVLDPRIDLTRYSELTKIRFLDFILQPGDAVFIPIGWWHQVTSLDFSVSMTHTNFHWPNEGHETHPG